VPEGRRQVSCDIATQPWPDHDFRNWRRRTFKPAARSALQLGENDPTPRPYDLRHTFVSLLIAEGRTLAYVAPQAGHSAEEYARTYLHLFDEHGDADPAERVSAEDAIRAARVRTEYPATEGSSGRVRARNPCSPELSV